MIIGHLGLAFAARRRWPRVALPWLVGATFAPDLWRLVLYAGGLGARSNEYSHFLPYSLLLAVVLGLAAMWSVGGISTLVAITSLVLSHVALDMISGTKALWNGGPIGLDLHHFQQAEFLLEATLCTLGWLAMRQLRAVQRVPGWPVLAACIVFEAAIMAISVGERRYMQRCPAYPILDCDESSWFTRKWNTGIIPLEWTLRPAGGTGDVIVLRDGPDRSGSAASSAGAPRIR